MPGRARATLYGVLFFASGAAGLVYQVVWMRELGLLFGNTAQAAGATLTAFFAGLALGGWAFGRRKKPLRRPLVTFALLELGIVVAALGALYIIVLYASWLPDLYAYAGPGSWLFTAIKLGLALVCLLPAAFLMGGTFPVLGEAFTRERDALGRSAGLLYALNTLGAATGAFLAAFVLPAAIGFRAQYGLAMATSAAVAVLAWVGDWLPATRGPWRAAPAQGGAGTLPRGLVVLAFLSGLGALALEVLWTRQLAIHLQNSVYTFGLILVVVLLALGGGALLARRLMRTRRLRGTLVTLLALSAGLVAWTPTWLDVVHEGGWVLRSGDGFTAYVWSVFAEGLIVLGPAALAIGTVFPFVMHLAPKVGRSRVPPAAVLGRLVAWNTVGAILGAFAAGFLIGPLVGPRVAASAVAVLYAAAALVVVRQRTQRGLAVTGALVAIVGVGLGLSVLQAREGLVPSKERLIEVYHGSGGTVTVSRRGIHKKLRINRGYALGGTADPRWEHLQAHIPLLIHPDPKDVFFIGLGTGITAGGAVLHDVDSITVAELVPEVVTAAKEHFAAHHLTHGLFEDERVTIRVEDARTILRGTRETYDVIVGDLFLPWKRGVGAVFNSEQLWAARKRLRPGGIYAQWLPLYQLSEEEFETIAATFQSVFREAGIWRGDFFDHRPIVALVGHEDRGDIAPVLDAGAFQARYEEAARRGWLGTEAGGSSIGFQLYAGHLSGAFERLKDVRRTTDAQPWIELLAPVHERARKAKRERAFTGKALLAFFEEMHAAVPPAKDPLLAGASTTQKRWVEAGRHLYAYGAYQRVGDGKQRRDAWRNWLLRVRAADRPEVEDWIR
ncbi:MAG: fused MFS/spermidine synthase [Planctomycetota bacterium]|nr:fused MFS/spermidine synthase [Planctomycetota bacterium]